MPDFNQTKTHIYGRRKGRPLRVRKSRLVKELLPRLLISVPSAGKIIPKEIFSREAPLILEIGFGGGEHLVGQATQALDKNFIGCEPFLNGVASLLDHLDLNQISNVRIFNDDARLILDALPDASVTKCFVLFADPWPKKRHAERRFIGPDTLIKLARVLKRGAILRLASDHTELVKWMQDVLGASKDFKNLHADIRPPADWVPTRYQEKAIAAGRVPFFMDYERL